MQLRLAILCLSVFVGLAACALPAAEIDALCDIAELMVPPCETCLDGCGNCGATCDEGETHVIGLSLAHKSLEYLPESIGNFTALRNLYIDDNAIRDLTPIAGLASLVILHMTCNQIHRIPDPFIDPGVFFPTGNFLNCTEVKERDLGFMIKAMCNSAFQYTSNLCVPQFDCPNALLCTEECNTCDNDTGCVPATNGTACTDDLEFCTDDHCVSGVCEHVPLANGTVCTNASEVCTSDYCMAGECEHFVDPDGTACVWGLDRGRCSNASCVVPAVPGIVLGAVFGGVFLIGVISAIAVSALRPTARTRAKGRK